MIIIVCVSQKFCAIAKAFHFKKCHPRARGKNRNEYKLWLSLLFSVLNVILLLLEFMFECPCRGESEKMFIKLHLRFAIVIVVRLECLAVSLTFVLLNSVGWIEDVRSASLARLCSTNFITTNLRQLGIPRQYFYFFWLNLEKW